ncbi:MAG TPA: maleylpyruvate isomerase family mycothiol-dependent enzyme [Acidimicrobiales bacterium]
MSTTEEQRDAYESAHARIDALVRTLNDEQLATNVPCCPQWTVKDVIGHLTGVLEDRVAGRMPTGGFGDWTNAQVERHRGESLESVLSAWNALPKEISDAPPSFASLSFDVVTHEHDINHALGVAGNRSSSSVRVGAERARGRMSSMLVDGGAPGVVATTEDGTHHVEGALAPIELATSRYSFMRLTTGRMSRQQAEALNWTGDPTAVLEALFADGFFTLQPRDVIEAELPS